MIVQDSEIITVLRQMNPWWQNVPSSGLPAWKRAAFEELHLWLSNPPAPRAVLLSGARQVGKTTLFLQAIDTLVQHGVNPSNIFYITFDHPILKLAGLETVMRLWRTIEIQAEGLEYVFIDEIQFIPDWQVWVKHQVDFNKGRRIALTGSAAPLVEKGQESGVGRWHTIRLATLSFYEFLLIRNVKVPELPPISSLAKLYDWPLSEFSKAALQAGPLSGQFHEYLLRGGFPQAALAASLYWSQKLLREDIVDKVLKRDMTALFGVRRVVELEHTFLYLCLHDGELLDMQTLCNNLGVKRPTAQNFIELLESVHLIHKLPPLGYGKEVLRGRHKIYLADAAIGPSVLSKGRALLEDEARLGKAVETAVFKHLYTRFYNVNVDFAYWRGKKNNEVDIIAVTPQKTVPFEIKYRNQNTGLGELKGLCEFCMDKKSPRGYVITKNLEDFGPLNDEKTGTEFMKIPAPLACYWLGQSELQDLNA